MSVIYCGCLFDDIYSISRMFIEKRTWRWQQQFRFQFYGFEQISKANIDSVYQVIFLFNQLDNLLGNNFMHSKRRMQRIQPQILIHRDPASRIKRSRRGSPIFVCCAIGRRFLIRTGLRVSAGMIDNAGKDFVGVKDEGCGVFVLPSQRV